MEDANRFLPHKVSLKRDAHGILLMESGYDLLEGVNSTGDWLEKWADETPDRVFIAERSGEDWRKETYRESLEKVRALASHLLGKGLNSQTPILMISGNSVDHGLLMLAAQYVGIPTVPVAEQYALIPQAHDRLRYVIKLVKPGLVYADDGDKYADALNLAEFDIVAKVSSRPGVSGAASIDDNLKGDAGVDLAGEHSKVGLNTVAKILMTSGSTSQPKGVVTTQRMMCVNQTQIASALPFLTEKPPIILDWLPWNHVFGGSHNFNMMLANGGSLYIDEGKPVKALFAKTLENLQKVAGTLSFNVPVGFGLLLEALEQDPRLAARYFENLDMVFYAGASLPQDTWQGLERLAKKYSGTVPLLTSSWGLTETAPACTLQHQPPESSGVIGVPLPGISVKLLPQDDGGELDQRYEIRVKGSSIFKEYFNDDVKSKEAFDDDGYFLAQDAVRFVDAEHPEKGLRFDGRISEDFKLTSGTWVRAAQLRLDLLATLSPLAADVVITGHDRDAIGVLIFPNREAIGALGFDVVEQDNLITGSELQAEISKRLGEFSKGGSSSTRVSVALIVSEPASLADGEITAKGNLNFRSVLSKRAALVEMLYASEKSPHVIVV